jgi:hypothetical protein
MRPKPLSRMRGAFWTAAALYFLPDVTTLGLRDETVALVARHRLPAIYWHSSFVRIGGLACYGPDQTDLLADQAGQNLAQRPGDGTACSGYESRSARSHSNAFTALDEPARKCTACQRKSPASAQTPATDSLAALARRQALFTADSSRGVYATQLSGP